MATPVDEQAADPELALEDAIDDLKDALDALPRERRLETFDWMLSDLRARYADDLPEPPPRVPTPEQRREFARHEAGHAVVAWYLGKRPWLAWIQGEDGRIPPDVMNADEYRRKDTIYRGSDPGGGVVSASSDGRPWSRSDPPHDTFATDAVVAYAGGLAQVVDERVAAGATLADVRQVINSAALDRIFSPPYARGVGADVGHANRLARQLRGGAAGDGDEQLKEVGSVDDGDAWMHEHARRAVAILTEPETWAMVDRLTDELVRVGVVGEAAMARILCAPVAAPTG